MYFCILALPFVEAAIHYTIQTMTWGMEEIESWDREYHLWFSGFWAILWLAIYLMPFTSWPIVLLSFALRNSAFPWALNLFHAGNKVPGRSIAYLSNNGSDGWLKRNFGEWPIFWLRLFSLIGSIFIFFHTQP